MDVVLIGVAAYLALVIVGAMVTLGVLRTTQRDRFGRDGNRR